MAGMNGMDDITLYFSLMNGIGDSVQSSLAAIWFAAEADVVAYGVIIGALILLALTALSMSHAASYAERVDEAMRQRMWARIVTYGDAWDRRLASVSTSATSTTDATSATSTTDAEDADASATDPGRAA